MVYSSGGYQPGYELLEDHKLGGDATASSRMSLQQTHQACEFPFHPGADCILSVLPGLGLRAEVQQTAHEYGQESGQMIQVHECHRALRHTDDQPFLLFYMMLILKSVIKINVVSYDFFRNYSDFISCCVYSGQ